VGMAPSAPQAGAMRPSRIRQSVTLRMHLPMEHLEFSVCGRLDSSTGGTGVSQAHW
jgi:hypothetical protein